MSRQTQNMVCNYGTTSRYCANKRKQRWSDIMGQRIDIVQMNLTIWSGIMGQGVDNVQTNLKTYGLKLWDNE